MKELSGSEVRGQHTAMKAVIPADDTERGESKATQKKLLMTSNNDLQNEVERNLPMDHAFVPH